MDEKEFDEKLVEWHTSNSRECISDYMGITRQQYNQYALGNFSNEKRSQKVVKCTIELSNYINDLEGSLCNPNDIEDILLRYFN